MLEERILPAIDSQAIPLTWTAANVIHVSDFIESRSDVDLFALNLAQGDVVQLDIDASTIGSGLDSYLRVFNSAGLQIAANDNFDATDSRLTFQAGSAGTYYFGVSSAGNDQYDPAAVPGPVPADLGPDRGFYNLTITRTANGAVTAAAPDLVGGSFEVVPNIAVAGDTITVRYRVENRGGAAVTGPFTVEFRLSTDNTFDGTDTAVVVLSTTLSPAQGSIVASGVEYLGGLAGGASFSDEITFTLPAIGSAPIFIGMRIDSAGQVSESNEANNNSTVRGSDWDALNVLNPTAVGPADSTSTFVLQSPAGSLAADFDGDGILDLAYLNSTTASNPIAGKFFTLAILRGAGDGTFALTGNLLPDSLPSITLSSMTSADFNGDGRADLVIAGPTQVYVFLANGAGGFSDPLAVANPLGLALDFGATGIVTGDFNADGRMDLAIAPATGFAVSGQLLVYLGQGDGSFTAQPGLTVTGTLDGPLVTGDFNRDGRLDLAAGSGLVFLGQAGGAFVQSTSTLAGGLEKMLVADFDHDGILDLAGVNPFSRELLISLGRGDGSFVAQPALMLNGNVNLTIGDFNGDGIVDLAMGTAGTVSVLLGRGISGQAAFAPALRFDTGDNSSFGSNTLTAGDLNGDGRIDLAMTQLDLEASALSHTSIHQLRWFFGRGDGSFQSAPIVRVGQSPTAIARGDFNRDGNVDLVVANLRSNDVSVLISAGDGTFADEIRYPVGAGPVQVVVGEFNADGRLDFAVQTAGGVSIFLGIGDGSFKLGGTFNSASGIMVAADFNGDGLTDLAIANEVYLAGPGMTFTRVSALLPGSVSAAADFNGDRILDLVLDFGGPFIALGNNDGTGHGNGTFTVMANSFRANAGGSLTTIADILSTSELNLTFPLGVVPTADFDGDGKRDLVIPVLDQTNPFLVIQTVLIFRGDSDGTFTLSGSLGVAAFADSRYSLDTGDFNGDGRDDLAVTTFNQFTDTTGQARVYLSEGIALPGADVQFSTIFVGPTGTFPVAVAVADLNGDKRPDLVTVDEGPESLSIFLNRGDGGFLNADEFVATTLQARPILTDVDGDGTADSLVLTQGGEILFRRGRPGQPGNFDAPVLINPGRPVRDLAVVTQNGKARLAALNLQPDQVSGLNQDFIVFYDWNPATKTFVRVQGPLISSLPTRIVAGDVTGDLREDLVVLSADGTLQVFASSGSSFVPAGAPLNVGAVPGLLALGNVDGVTGLDLIVGQPDAGEVRIVPIVPAPTFGAPLLFRTGAGLYESGSGALARELTWSIQVADFNRDSILDLVVTNRNANTFALLLGQGAGTFSEPRVFATGSLPTEIVVGDFSNDNRLDVAVLNLNDATVTVYLGDGLGNFFLAATVAAGNLPNGLASNDVNADGNLDLVIQNEFGDLLFILGNGNGTFRPFVRAGGNVPFVTTDINGDGVADVLLANQSVDQVLSQIRNAGSTTFSLGGFSQTSADGVQAPGFVDLEDINNDGIQDLLVTNTGSNNIIVYLGTAPGQFSSNGLSFFTGTSPVSATVFDFNGDNLADVAVANQGSNDVSILLGSVDASGNWTLTTGPRLDVGLGPNNIAINDFDGDGTLDLMVTSGQAGQLWMLPGLGNGFFDDGNPTILSLPGQIVQTLYTLTTGFTLLQSGSIFNFNPFSLTTATNVFNSAANALVTALTFVPNSTSFFAGRSDSSIALLNADAGGNYAESLIFSDARLDSPSALSVVGNELYVTNQGSSLPLVFGLDGLFAPGIDFGSGFDDPTGSVTTLDSIDQARLSVIATVLASAGSSNTDEEASDEEGDENAFVAGLNAGLIGSTSLLGLLLAQEVSAESGDEEVSEEGEAEQETPVWVEFVVGLQDAIDEFRASLLQDQDDAVATTALDRWLAEVARWLAATTSDKGNGTAMPSHALASNDAQVGAATARPGQEEAVLPMAQAAQPADAEALAALPEALFDLPVLWREWWPALAAATLTSCAWLGWRQKRNSSERSSR